MWLCLLQWHQEGEDVFFCLFTVPTHKITKSPPRREEGARLRMGSVQEHWLSPREMSFLMGY